MLDFSREFAAIREPVLAAMEAVCASQRFILGPEVARFEAAAAAACGTLHGIGCASGTDALWLALAALRIGTGESGAGPSGPPDAVLTTPFSFFATVSSILRAGAQPVLADIDPRTFNLSPEDAARKLRNHATRSELGPIKAVMPVHLYGQCADMDALHTLAIEHRFTIVEDAAQAFGARWNDRPAGTLGHAAAFSFYPTKNLAAYGDAGLVTTNDPDIAERVAMLRAHGMRRRYFHDEVGWNSRLDTLQAAVLSVKLPRVEAGNTRRRELARLYDNLFTIAGLIGTTTAEGVVLPWIDPRAEHAFHQYVIRVPRRDDLRAYLADNEIGSEIYYPLPLHLQESLRFLGYQPGDFPESERAAQEVLALPIYPELREAEAETVVEAIRRFYA